MPVNHRPRCSGEVVKYGIFDRLGVVDRRHFRSHVAAAPYHSATCLFERGGTDTTTATTPYPRGGVDVAMTAKGRPAAADLNLTGRLSVAKPGGPGDCVLLGLLAVGVAAAWCWRGVLDPTTITAAIGRYPAAPLCFLAVWHTAASLLFMPRTLLG